MSWRGVWMDSEQKALSLLGLARKAGRVMSGEFQTEKAVKSGKAKLVVLAGDASDNTKKKFCNMCAWYHVPVTECSDKTRLGSSIGCESRSCLAVLDPGLAGAVMKALGLHAGKQRRE